MQSPLKQNFTTQNIVMAHTIRTTNSRESGPHAQLGHYWQDFFTKYSPNVTPESFIFAVYTNYEIPFNVQSSKYDFFCGISNPQNIKAYELTPFTIPAGNYVVFKGKGPMPQTIIKTWQDIWAYFSQPQEYERAFGVDFQLHDPEKPDEVEIYISVK